MRSARAANHRRSYPSRDAIGRPSVTHSEDWYRTPQRQAYERSAAFKQGQRFRAGIEGRISVLMRGRGMKRCRAEGAERFALFVGAAVLANNLMIVAALLTKRSSRRSWSTERRPTHERELVLVHR
jgi:hypothetical protein